MIKEWIRAVARGPKGNRPLTMEEAEAAARSILDGTATPAQAGALLAAIRVKGDTAEEIAGFARALEAHLPPRRVGGVQWSGGLDGRRRSVVASIGAALVLSGYLPVTLLAAFALPPKKAEGVADVWRALRLPFGFIGEEGPWCVLPEEEIPALGRLRPLREELGVRTLWSVAERLVNYAGADLLAVGVQHRHYLERIGSTLALLGTAGTVFLGIEGSEEPRDDMASNLVRAGSGDVSHRPFDPGGYGSLPPETAPLPSVADQAKDIVTVLQGEEHPLRGRVLLQAAFLWWQAGKSGSLGEAVKACAALLEQGEGLRRLERMGR